MAPVVSCDQNGADCESNRQFLYSLFVLAFLVCSITIVAFSCACCAKKSKRKKKTSRKGADAKKEDKSEVSDAYVPVAAADDAKPRKVQPTRLYSKTVIHGKSPLLQDQKLVPTPRGKFPEVVSRTDPDYLTLAGVFDPFDTSINSAAMDSGSHAYASSLNPQLLSRSQRSLSKSAAKSLGSRTAKSSGSVASSTPKVVRKAFVPKPIVGTTSAPKLRTLRKSPIVHNDDTLSERTRSMRLTIRQPLASPKVHLAKVSGISASLSVNRSRSVVAQPEIPKKATGT